MVHTGLLPFSAATASPAGYKAPTTRDIPPVALTNIPKVNAADIQHYLDTIGPLVETYERSRAAADPAQVAPKDRDAETTDAFTQAVNRKLSKDGSWSPTLRRRASANILSPETPSTPQFTRKSSAQYKRNRNEPTPLSTIPNVYFDEDFHLEDPRTFDIVSERAEIVRQSTSREDGHSNGAATAPRKNLVQNAILQEKLSWYMDTVEIHLINSISAASSGFFAALGSLKQLQNEAEQSVNKIERLRADLKRLDHELALGGLEVAAKTRRRRNVQELRKATDQISLIVEAVKGTDQLVDDGKYDEAVDKIGEVERLVTGRAGPATAGAELRDLSSLQVLRGLETGMLELQFRIGAGFAQRFTTALLNDLRQHVERVPPSQTLKRWSKQRGIPPAYLEATDQLRTDLQASIKGLVRCSHTAPAVAAFKEAAVKEMKTIIRRYLPSSSDDDADSMISASTRAGRGLTQQEKSSILARNLRSLDTQDAEDLLVKIYTSISEALRRLSTQAKVLLDVTSRMDVSKSVRAEPDRQDGAPDALQLTKISDDLSQVFDISALLGQAVDTAQTQLSRVLKVRNEQTIRLSKQRHLRYFMLNRLFLDECEAVSGRAGQNMRGVVNAQISGFIQVLGQANNERIVEQLDLEKWDAADLPEQEEIMLERILSSVEKDATEWRPTTQIWERLPASEDAPSMVSEPISAPATNGTGTAKPQTKPAIIDGNRYILVASAIALIPSIDSFLALTSALPTMTSQISASLLEVLRTFNSRSSQLILGAGATRSAGLKNITTKHLALASQALSFVIALVPYQRECVRRHLSAGAKNAAGQAVLAEWDKTKRLYQDHQMGIHDKLVEIMTGRSATHVKSMLALDFSSAAADAAGEGKPSPYMETLIKETLTLHRVLVRHLSVLDVSLIMRQIFSNYKDQWTKAYAEVSTAGNDAERRLVRDVEALEDRLGRVDEFKEIGRDITVVVKTRINKETVYPAVQQPSSTTTTQENSTET